MFVPEGVTEVANYAFRNCGKVERVVLPSTLKVISDGAFSFSKVVSVEISDSVETVDDHAFWHCNYLQKVTFGANVNKIGRQAFEGCFALTSVELPDKLIEIGENAFGGTRLTDVVIPASVKFIGRGAFAACDIASFTTKEGSPFAVVNGCLIDVENKKLIAGCNKSQIPDDGTVTSIASKAFCGYTFGENQSVLIPFAVTEIDNDAFCECSHLLIRCKVDEYNQPEGWDEHWYAYPEPWEEDFEDEKDYIIVKWDCLTDEERAEKERILREKAEAEEKFRLSQANDYVRENGIMSKYVGDGGDVVIPPDVKIILAHAFDGCNNISSVKLHYFVSSVEEGTFDVFKGTDVQFYFQAEQSPQGFNDYRFKRENLHFCCMTEQERKQVEEELSRRKTEELALRGFEVQGEYLRKYNGNEEYVVLPYNDVSDVDEKAFKDNSKIKTVHFGTVDEILDGAFESCVNLEKVVLPDTVTSLEPSVFRNCEKLNIERFPVLLKEIRGLALSNTAQEEICLNLCFVGNGAFSHCKNLKKAVINSDGSCTMRWQAFFGCPNLEEVELNFEGKELEWSVFEGCHSLKRIKLPNNLQKIGHGAFKDCMSLGSIEIPSTVTEISSQAFLNCQALSNLTIPDSVTEIGDGAFLGCSSMTLRTTITLPKRFEKDLRRIFGEWKDPFQFNDGPRFVFV